MVKITWHDAEQAKTSEFATMRDFLSAQEKEVPALQDNATVDRLEIDDGEIPFTGSIFDLYRTFSH